MGKKFNEIVLPEKEDFYSHLNMENITGEDYAHAKIIRRKFRRISWFVCSKRYIIVIWCILRTLEICLKIYELDPAKYFSATGLAWQAALKKD